MSTRVQKGNATFKPVAKPRGRTATPASRQTSAAVENPAPRNAGESMPPPSIIPNKQITETPPPEPARASAQPPPVATPQSRPSSIIVPTQRAPVSSVPRQSAPTPLVVGQSRATPIVISRSDAPTSHLPNTISPPSASQDSGYSYIDIHTSQNISNSSAPDLSTNNKTPHQNGPSSTNVEAGSEAPRAKKKRAPRATKSTISSGAEASANNVESSARRKRTRRNLVAESDISSVEEGDDGPTPRKRKRKASSGPRKPRKSRAPSVPPFDPDADPGEELDPTVVTMATLCNDTGQGRISTKAVQIQTNHAAWKTVNREKRARMRLLMESRKYGRKENGENISVSAAEKSGETQTDNADAPDDATNPSNEAAPEPSGPQIQDVTGSGFDYSQALATSRFNVQVRIGPNGETIIDEESLFVDRNEEEDTTNYTHVEESDTTKFVNSGTYGKKFRGSRWSAEETELFYDALSQFGENYELISYILPGRDRKACKNKFKAEDKKSPSRITYCLTHRIPYDMQTLSRMTGKDFSGPTPEIRAPTPLTLREPDVSEDAQEAEVVSTRKQSKTPGLSNDEEVLGDAAGFEDEEVVDSII